MIDEKKIEEAANEYSQDNCGYSYNIEKCLAFEHGAHWVIEQLLNLWHHKSEIPDGKILCIDYLDYPYGMEWFRDDHYDEDWDAIVNAEQIKGWIYVKDLLPLMKKCLD